MYTRIYRDTSVAPILLTSVRVNALRFRGRRNGASLLDIYESISTLRLYLHASRRSSQRVSLFPLLFTQCQSEGVVARAEYGTPVCEWWVGGPPKLFLSFFFLSFFFPDR